MNASSSQNVSPKVYVVDDDPDAVKSLLWLLTSEGLIVEAFASVNAYLQSQCYRLPGCLVLDIRMPEMNGLDVQRELAARGEHHPIIFVTGHGDVPMSARAFKSGAIDFLEKPVDDEALLQSIHRAFELDARRRASSAQARSLQQRMQQLTPREAEVMQLLLQGKSMKQICAKFGISAQTTSKHRMRVLEKMGVDNEVSLIRMLVDAGYNVAVSDPSASD